MYWIGFIPTVVWWIQTILPSLDWGSLSRTPKFVSNLVPPTFIQMDCMGVCLWEFSLGESSLGDRRRPGRVVDLSRSSSLRIVSLDCLDPSVQLLALPDRVFRLAWPSSTSCSSVCFTLSMSLVREARMVNISAICCCCCWCCCCCAGGGSSSSISILNKNIEDI